jgi:5-methylcytosine-specific restriction endonuclease McrA
MLPNAQPRPERRSAVKKRQAKVRRLSRAQCRDIVFRREHGKCQRCGRAVTYDCWPWEPQRAHVNELVPRSKGGDPRDPDGCELCCRECHLPNGQHAPTPERLKKLKAMRRKKAA